MESFQVSQDFIVFLRCSNLTEEKGQAVAAAVSRKAGSTRNWKGKGHSSV